MQFLNPLFLIGLSAIAIPIAIHFFNLRRYKKVYFSDISKLEELAEETKRQSRLKHLLILVARILAIAFLAIAFAQPVIPPKENSLQSGNTAVGVYIDNSFSMEGGTEAGTLLDKAKRKAKEIVAGFSPSDRFMLITNDMAGSQFRLLSPDEFSTAVDEVEVSPVSPSLSTVTKRLFAALGSDNSSDNRTAYLITDFQSSAADIEALPSDSATRCYLVPLQGTAQNNLFIDSLSFDAPAYTQGNVVSVAAHIHNSGSEAVENLQVKLTVNDKERAVASTDIAANAENAVKLQFTIDNNAILHGSVSIADYPITFDDEIFFCINPTSEIATLSTNERTDNQYIRRLFGNDSLIAYRSCTANAAGYEDFSQYDLIIVNEVVTLQSGLAENLRTFAENGGTVLLLPSKEMDLTAYNRFAKQMRMPEFKEFVGGELKVSHTNTSHPLYRNVFERQGNDFEQPTVFGHFRATPSGSMVKESLLTLADGGDLLSFTKCGNGGIYLLSAPLDAQYTNFGSMALFVPTMYNIALHSGKVPDFYHFIGNDIAISAKLISSGNVLKISALNGSSEIIPEMAGSADSRIMRTHGNLQTAGNYVVATDNKVVEGIAFNYDRRESEMSFLSEDEIADAIKSNSSLSLIKSTGKPLDQLIRSQREGKPLWHIFLILSLLMLATEICLIKLMKN